jgi:hypothetical protein
MRSLSTSLHLDRRRDVGSNASHVTNRGDESLNEDDGMLRHEFAPGEEPTVYTADICAEVGHKQCKGIETGIEGYEGKEVFCVCLCHRVIKGDSN